MSTPASPPEAPTKIPHLVMALLFLGTAAVWALVVAGLLTVDAVPYALPALLVLAGVGGLVAVVLGGRGTRRQPEQPAQPQEHEAHEAHDELDEPPVWADDQTVPLDRPEDHR